ncbi:MAG: ABC transporter ATP-binding protein [Planctomycetes bacterium]|nr:ABC transporter ATP-binding protein [Planctomycetota bacterium]
MSEDPILSAEDVRFAYDGAPVLSGIDLAVPGGDFLAVIGPNGAGKTTLLRLLAGLLVPASGAVRLSGKNVATLSRREVARRAAWVPQALEVPFAFTAREFVAMSRYPHLAPFAAQGAADREAVERALARAGAAVLERRPLGTLSGGERQRVLVAAALAQETPVLLLDEPSAHLDPRHAIEIYELLASLSAREGRTVVAVTHDLTFAARFARRILLLAAGRTRELGTPDEVLREDVLAEVYRVSWTRLAGPDGPVLVPGRPLP